MPLTPAGVPILAAVLGLVPAVVAAARDRAGGVVSWTAIVALGRRPPTRSRRSGRSASAPGRSRRARTASSHLLAVPLLAALVLVQTFDAGGRLTVDARVPALAVAAVLVWRRAPFLVVVLAAAATAAALRAIG